MGKVNCTWHQVIGGSSPPAGDLLFEGRAAVRVERLAQNSFAVKHYCERPSDVSQLAANDMTALVARALRKEGYQAVEQGLYK